MFRAVATKFHVPRILSCQQANFATIKRTIVPPFTAEELAWQRKVFRSMPSYNPQEQTVKSCDYFKMFEDMGYVRTKEQIQNYQNHSNQIGGKIDIVEFMGYMSTVHDPKLLLQKYADSFDKDKDVYISESEYVYIVELLAIHEPNVKLGDYKQFVKEADLNKDGKVSVDELQIWLYR